MPRNERPTRVERGLYKTGDTYLACATPPGSRQARWRTLGEVGLMQARRLRDNFAAEIGAGPAPLTDSKTLFTAVSALWLAEQQHLVDVGELRPKTYEAYEVAVRLHLDPWFGSTRVQAIGTEQLNGWHAAQRKSGAKRSTIRGRWIALRGVLTYATRHKLIATNPADLLTRRERPKTGEARVRVLNDAEMVMLLQRAPLRYRRLVTVLLFCGLRISEALALVWSEIDLDKGLIYVRYQLDRKGKRQPLKTGYGLRDVVLMDSAARILREAKIASPFSGPLDFAFATGNGTPLSQRNATRAFARATGQAEQKEALERGRPYVPCGLEDVTPHVCRHTFASILIERGRDVPFVSDQLGHHDPGFTLRTYVHLFRAARQAQQARDELEAEYGHMLTAVSS